MKINITDAFKIAGMATVDAIEIKEEWTNGYRLFIHDSFAPGDIGSTVTISEFTTGMAVIITSSIESAISYAAERINRPDIKKIIEDGIKQLISLGYNYPINQD